MFIYLYYINVYTLRMSKGLCMYGYAAKQYRIFYSLVNFKKPYKNNLNEKKNRIIKPNPI